MPAFTLPPYGFLPSRYTERPLADLAAPRDFLAAIEDRTDAKQKKNEFIEAFAMDVAANYWPIWSERDQVWQGESAGSMVELTRVDLAVLAEFRQPLFDYVTVDGRTIFRTHLECFEAEDMLDARAPATNFDELLQYAPTLPGHWAKAFAGLFKASFDRKVGPMTMQWKTLFQRPRPYQAAMVLGRAGLSHRLATTAQHPALVAGHCMQGLFGGVGVHQLWAEQGGDYSPALRATLEQYAVDFGDRRVMAGVHYPSDTLISWLACFALLEKVVSPAAVAESASFLRRAIRRSHVLRKVQTSTHPSSCVAYKRLVEAVESRIADV